MELILGVIVVTILMGKAVSNAKLDHTYAKRGDVSPRLRAKYGSADRANAKCAKYGFTDYLRDAWRDYWPRRTDALVAARNTRTVDGKRPPFWARVRAGQEAATSPSTPTATSPPGADEPPVVPAGPAIDPALDDPPTLTNPDPKPGSSPDFQPTPLPTPTAPTNGGTSMSAPTGEAVNYETTVAEIDAQIGEVQRRIDADMAALSASAQLKAAVDAVQTGYQNAATAAQTKLDHQAALNLDGTTLGHAGNTVDAMPPNAVDGLYEQVEIVEQLTRERLAADEIALASLEAELAHITGTYGDAHATVAGNLGGDSRFLDSGNGSTTSGYSPAATSDKAADTANQDDRAEYATAR